MDRVKLISAITIATLTSVTQVKAENINHLSQLLNTKQCENCDLSNSGLVMNDLSGANLSGANLVGANLSRADLTGANLSGANLSGATLFGANLSGANLSGATLTNTDMRNAYLVNANFQNSNISSAYVQGAIGITHTDVSATQLYLWGLQEDQEGNYRQAIQYYSKAITIDPELAPAYLGRAIIKSRYGNMNEALEDAEQAQQLFETQNNGEGYALSTRFMQLAEARIEYEANNGEGGSPQFVQIVNTVAPLLFKFFSPF